MNDTAELLKFTNYKVQIAEKAIVGWTTKISMETPSDEQWEIFKERLIELRVWKQILSLINQGFSVLQIKDCAYDQMSKIGKNSAHSEKQSIDHVSTKFMNAWCCAAEVINNATDPNFIVSFH